MSIVARSYAQFTGILAGFAFVVINLVLDRAYGAAVMVVRWSRVRLSTRHKSELRWCPRFWDWF